MRLSNIRREKLSCAGLNFVGFTHCTKCKEKKPPSFFCKGYLYDTNTTSWWLISCSAARPRSETCNKHDKETPKDSRVYSEWGVLLPVFDIWQRMRRCGGKRKIVTRVPSSLCDVTQTAHPSDPTFELVVCAARMGVALLNTTPL